MAYAVLAAVERRSLPGGHGVIAGAYLRPWDDGASHRVAIDERPPLATARARTRLEVDGDLALLGLSRLAVAGAPGRRRPTRTRAEPRIGRGDRVGSRDRASSRGGRLAGPPGRSAAVPDRPGVPGSGSIGVTGVSGTTGVGASAGWGTSRSGVDHDRWATR